MGLAEVPAWLEDAASQAPYRRNAFRISGLEVTATPRSVRRRASQIRAAEAMGAEGVGGARWLPVEPAPDHVAVREALRRLEDPVRRVVDELFWFWPLPETDGLGLPAARDVWGRLAGARTDDRARSVAVHNLAVLDHAEAVELLGGPDRKAAWRRAYRHWRRALDDDGCWRWMDERIRELGDPRLRPVSGAALRDALPAVLLAIHARLAVEAARQPDGADAAREHVTLMREFAAGDGPVEEILRRATSPIASGVIRRSEAVAGSAGSLDRDVAPLLDEAEPDLRVLGAVLGAEHPVTAGAADAVATTVNTRVVAHADRVGPGAADPTLLRPAIELLRTARRLAASGHVRDPIEQNLFVLVSNDLRLTTNNAVERAKASPRLGAQQASRLLDEVEPRLRELRRLRPDEPERNKVSDAVALAASRMFTNYFNATGDAEKSLAGYRRALPLAASREGRSLIQKNIDTLADADALYDLARCRRCGRALDGSELSNLRIRGSTVEIPLCADCANPGSPLAYRPTPTSDTPSGSHEPPPGFIRSFLGWYEPWVPSSFRQLVTVPNVIGAALLVAAVVVGVTGIFGAKSGDVGVVVGTAAISLITISGNRKR